MTYLSMEQKEILTSALKLKLTQLTKLEKKIKAELGDDSDAAKAVLKEITLTQELFRTIELSKGEK